MEAFFLKTITSIQNKVRNGDLKKACDDLSATLGGKYSSLEKDKVPDNLFYILKQACESKQSDITTVALDAIHYLIEHGLLRDDTQQTISLDNKISPSSSPTNINNEHKDKNNDNKPLTDTIIEAVSACSDSFDENVQLQVIKCLLTAVTSHQCAVHETTLLLAVRACFHVHLISKNVVIKTTARAALTQMISATNKRMEDADEALSNANNNNDNNNNNNDTTISKSNSSSSNTLSSIISNTNELPTKYHRDAWLLFRAICKLSTKGTYDDAIIAKDDVILQNKLLSLESIELILNSCGPAFKTNEKFINCVRSYLCVSLLSNCASDVKEVATLSLRIFATLLDLFKDHLKDELEVFVTNIFLKILESENSTAEHKYSVLNVLESLCKDSAALVQLFINYDCDLSGIDLFKRIVDAMAKISKSVHDDDGDGVSDKTLTNTLVQKGVSGLLTVLQSLVETSHVDTNEPVAAEITTADAEAADGDEHLDPISNGDVDSNHCDDVTPSMGTVEVFDRKQKIQVEISTGILKFNFSAKRGIKFLVEMGHIEKTPTSVAMFLRQYHERLDKTIVGDYISREKEYENGFCMKVLHAYVDSMEFTDMMFDEALRYFLEGFRLPGEAQKIDRLMEKFAERYYLQNQGTFASADMAFILAFSTIMLQTNLHNPAIKDDKRMSVDQFVRQNKGISTDGELDDDMLIDIYHRIKEEPITLKQDEKLKKTTQKNSASSYVFFPNSVDQQRKEAFSDERKEMVRTGEAIFKQNLRSKRGASSFFVRTVPSFEPYVRPMLEVCWGAMLSVFSQVLASTPDDVVEHLDEMCFAGIELVIRLATRLDLVTARDTFMQTLAHLTRLGQRKAINFKNAEAVQVLIRICIRDGDYLGTAWAPALRCLSEVSRLQQLALGQTDEVGSGDQKVKRISDQLFLFTSPNATEQALMQDEANAELLALAVDAMLIDRVFVTSQYMSSDGVQHFVRSLCNVSLEEIGLDASKNSNRRNNNNNKGKNKVRAFSLQKLVEVADVNMGSRSRLDWAKLWGTLASHFTEVGMHPNQSVAMFAVDSLKQLSMKFLEKDELSNFNFQRLFLRPFEVLISRSKSVEIKELVLSCIDIMLQARSSNIRSGWKAVFSTFSAAAKSSNLNVVTLAFQMLLRVRAGQNNNDTQSSEGVLVRHDIIDMMNCLVTFVGSQHTKISVSALEVLAESTDLLMGAETSGRSGTTAQTSEEAVFRFWWPLLLGLSSHVSDERLQVRSTALEILHSILRNRGAVFSAQMWSMVYKGVLFPMMESARSSDPSKPLMRSQYPSQKPGLTDDKSSWLGSTGVPTVEVIVNLFQLYQETTLIPELLNEILMQLENFICQEDEATARLGLYGLSRLLRILPLFIHTVKCDSNYDNHSGRSPLKKHNKGKDSDRDRDRERGIEEGFIENAVSEMLCRCVLRNLCLNFGSAGSLLWDNDTPLSVKALQLKHFSHYTSSDSTQSTNDLSSGLPAIGNEVTTPYGKGMVESVEEEVAMSGKIRVVVRLSGWQATLYTYMAADATSNSNINTTITAGGEELLSEIMTRMVVVLDICGMLTEVMHQHVGKWSMAQCSTLMTTLEACYHHARCFNQAIPLRSQLKQQGFMLFPRNSQMEPIRMPHLLEQEVSSIIALAHFSMQSYKQFTNNNSNSNISNISGNNSSPTQIQRRPSFDEEELSAVMQEWLQTSIECITVRFLQLDAIQAKDKDMERDRDTLFNGNESKNNRNGSSSGVSFTAEQREGYRSALLMLLQEMKSFSNTTFRMNVSWLSPLLSQLVTTADTEIRTATRDIYDTLVNPLLIAAGKLLPPNAENW